MSLTITLYAGCKLTSKYNQVFKDRNTMATYLGTVSHLDVYTGDDIYYTNSGTISIDNSSLLGHDGDKYNYMQFTTTSGGISTKRFAFVNNITIVNEVAVIEYSEDIWHTYAIKDSSHQIKLFNSLLQQAKSLNGGTGYEYTATQIANLPKMLPVQPEGQNNPSFKGFTVSDPAQEQCYILITASVFKLTAQGEVNVRFVSNYLLSYQQSITGGHTPAASGKNYIWDLTDTQTLELLSTIQAKSSDTTVNYKTLPNFNYEIIDVKIIPENLGTVWFDDYLTGDSNHDAGLHDDFSLPLSMYDLDNTGLTYYDFDTTIAFNNLVIASEYKYISGSALRYTYNGISQNTVLSCTKTYSSDKEYVALANLSRVIPITFNGLSKTAVFELSVNLYNNSIRLLFDNTITDISQDFTLHIPISSQGADITQQQKIALRTGNIVQSLGLVSQAYSLGASIGSAIGSGGATMQSDIAGQSSKMVGQATNLISGAVQLDSRNQAQYVSNKVMDVNDTTIMNCVLGGLRELKMNYLNDTLLDSIINAYGYIYSLLVNSFDTVYSTNNYVKFTQANVYGDFSQSIADGLANILENGVILL